MNKQAIGKFEIKTWDEKTWEGKPAKEVSGAKLTRASITQAIHGDIEGEGAVEFLMVYESDGSAAFVGLQRITGRLGGRSGSFVLQGNGTFADSTAKGTWAVVPGSGTEGLRGLRGEGGFVSHHGESVSTLTLDYEFAA